MYVVDSIVTSSCTYIVEVMYHVDCKHCEDRGPPLAQASCEKNNLGSLLNCFGMSLNHIAHMQYYDCLQLKW